MRSPTDYTNLPLWATLHKIVGKIEAFPRAWLSVEVSHGEATHIKTLMEILKTQDLDSVPSEETTKLKEIILKLSELRGLAELQANGRVPSFILHFDKPATQAKFTPFKKLPSELRDMIWGHAMPKNRILEVFPIQPTWNPGAFPSLAIKPASHTTISRLLAVCKESQAAVLRKYNTKVLAKDMDITSLGDSANILLDPKSDIVYYNGPIDSMSLVFKKSSKFLQSLRGFGRIALNLSEFRMGLAQRRHSQRRRATRLRRALQAAAFNEVMLISERAMRYWDGDQPGLFEDRRPLTWMDHRSHCKITRGWKRVLNRQAARGELSGKQKKKLSCKKFTFVNRVHPALLYYLIQEYVQIKFHVTMATAEGEWIRWTRW